MGILDKFKGRTSEHDTVVKRLAAQEELTEELANRVSLLEAHVAIFKIRGERERRGSGGPSVAR